MLQLILDIYVLGLPVGGVSAPSAYFNLDQLDRKV